MFYLFEIFYLIITIFLVGLIFSRDFSKKEILLSSKIVGISIVLHELAHKLFAILFGYSAIYNVYLLGLILGLFLRLIESPIIFFIPGYVSITGSVSPLHGMFISLVGPLTNLLLFILGTYLYKNTNNDIFYVFKTINLWLFIINMIPIPPLDGGQFLYNLYMLFQK